MGTRTEGYRYVREYLVWNRWVEAGKLRRWALWEVREGRARRVGTAHSQEEYQAWLKEGRERLNA